LGQKARLCLILTEKNVALQCKLSSFKVEHDGTDLFVVCDGNRIAKRGHPGTPQAATWIPLEPGYSVSDDEGPKTIIPPAKNERTRAAA